MTMTMPDFEWPDSVHDIECVGLDGCNLYDLIFAIDHDRVKVVSSDLHGFYYAWTFDFMNVRYELVAGQQGMDALVPLRIEKITNLSFGKGEQLATRLVESPKFDQYKGAWGAF